MRARALILIALLSAAGCNQVNRTGEPVIYSIDTASGALLDRDVVAKGDDAPVVPHKGEMICVVVNNVFVRYVSSLLSPHVMVYAEVYDDGSDDPSSAVSKVLFNQTNQPSGVNLGLADRVLYGPTAYKGFPLRIRLYIVALQKDQQTDINKLLDTAGTVATTVKPEAAAAVGIILGLAKSINALTEDDFELRFDLTLYPVIRAATANVNDRQLATLKDANDLGEPSQRQGQDFALVMPLRVGSYVVMKRELKERFGKKGDPSTVYHDWTQEAFLGQYKTPEGADVSTQEILRFQGGYLYLIPRSVNGSAQGHAMVVTPDGPNKGMIAGVSAGIRKMFNNQTYVALTVLNGLPEGLTAEQLRASSDRDAKQISDILINSGDTNVNNIASAIDQLSDSIKTEVALRSVSQSISKRVGRDPTFRTSTDYPLAWAQQLLTPDPSKPAELRNAVAQNTAILAVLSDLILNLPITKPDDPAAIGKLQKLKASDLEAVPNTKGIFKLTDAFLNPPAQ